MIKILKFQPSSTYTDVEYVDGIVNGSTKVTQHFFEYCKEYFEKNYRAVFFVQDEDAKDIFQNTCIALFQNIERKKIYVEEGVLKGKGGLPFEGSLSTYLMGIARLKYLEWVRGAGKEVLSSESDDNENKNKERSLLNAKVVDEWISNDPQTAQREIIDDCLSKMSERCYEILTKFYDEEKKLDQIMLELNTFKSKDALKTAKNKCLDKLRTSSVNIYNQRRNSKYGY